MSTHLWRYFLGDDVDSFRRILANASFSSSTGTKHHATGGITGAAVGSPGRFLSTSPHSSSKSRKVSTSLQASYASKTQKANAGLVLTRADVNSKDIHGVTLLHHISSSTGANAPSFALALLEVTFLDLYIQDIESGWTALHRALYFGNITIARALIERDARDSMGYASSGNQNASGLIKIKDREGNSPFDVFGYSVATRSLRQNAGLPILTSGIQEDEDEIAQGESGDGNSNDPERKVLAPRTSIMGDELFTFGSNKNFTLGFGDSDDRQYPERILLKRPAHLLYRLKAEHLARYSSSRKLYPIESKDLTSSMRGLPALVEYKPIIIQDVQLSKLHTAVLTSDPEANLYICGFGSGGRLGTGDEVTRVNFQCIHEGGLQGKKVIHVALGQDHTIALSSEGEVFTWGSNACGQLGYSSPESNIPENQPVQLLPRQIYGPLKRETVIGAAASRIHSVVHTASSLFTFGRNDGQLGLVDSDARSLGVQLTPRKVAASLFSSTISMITAIDRATACLLENHDVWIFANYGYTKMQFPLEGFSNYFLKNSYSATRYDGNTNHIIKVTSGGDTLCALGRMGDVFTVNISQNLKQDPGPLNVSTTNPAKIRGAVSAPQRVWSLRKGHMSVKDVDVGQDGSIIICTESGSVWRRVKRAKIKDTVTAAAAKDYKPKDYKFSRIPGLTRVTAVRSNAFGAFAAVRRDCDVLKMEITVASHTLWKDLFPLLPFHKLSIMEDSDDEEPAPRFWTPRRQEWDTASIRQAVLASPTLKEDVLALVTEAENRENAAYDIHIGTTVSDIRVPCHEFIFGGRSNAMQRALQDFRTTYFSSIPDVLTIEYDKDGKIVILLQGMDFITLLNLVLYLYTDSMVDVWHHTRHVSQLTSRYRLVRTELMKLASHLGMRGLEQAARIMTEPSKIIHQDLESAVLLPEYFITGDVKVLLNGSTAKVHSALIIRRCPFFEGLFSGRAAGRWLSGRQESQKEPQEAVEVDLKHVDPAIFNMVRRHLYADTGEELFDMVCAVDLDAFLDLVMDVLAVANELMLERLSEICQKVLGRFVNTRNVCQLLNAVAPCSISSFKDAALEYICLNLEGMLENHLLNELEDDLMFELDQVVRENQLACLPISKSGRATAELYERYPQLAEIVERSKQAVIDSMALDSRFHEDEARFEHSSRAGLHTPSLKPKSSHGDMMFAMDDEVDQHAHTSSPRRKEMRQVFGRNQDQSEATYTGSAASLPEEDDWYDARGKRLTPGPESLVPAPPSDTVPADPSDQNVKVAPQQPESSGSLGPADNKAPWKSPVSGITKVDMRDILAQASGSRMSNISSGLSLRSSSQEISESPAPTKLSQRERKKQLQQQQMQHHSPSSSPLHPTIIAFDKPSSPWQKASTGIKVSLKDILNNDQESSGSAPNSLTSRTPSNPPMTLRQTVSGTTKQTSSTQQATSPPQALPSQRSASTPIITKPPVPNSPSPSTTSRALKSPEAIAKPSLSPSVPSIRSIRHNHEPSPVEPSLQLSMADILSQQQTEKDVIKEAVAKRSLQEIQDEQAFQEWWESESRKVREAEQEAEQETIAEGSGGGGGGNSSHRGRGRGPKSRGRGGGGGVRGGNEGRGRGGSRGKGRAGAGAGSGGGRSTGGVI